MATVSDAFDVADSVARTRCTPEPTSQRAQVRARAHARGYASRTVIGKRVVENLRLAGADLREAWWMPASMPTWNQAWADRKPDIERVPGRHRGVWLAWCAYSHTVGLLVPIVGLVLVGAVTPVLWAARHPARFALLTVLVTSTVALAVR